VTDYEYGIRHKKSLSIHRSGMTEEEADQWMKPVDDASDWAKVFEVVKRAITDWEPNITDSSEQQPGFCWAVVFSNYDPTELEGLFATRALAEKRVEELGTGWHAERWAIQGWKPV
jgi:hypothetical protein